MLHYARIKSRLLAAAVAFPLLWLAFFYWLVLRTRLAVGHWPYCAHPDPKDTGFHIHNLLLMWGLLAFPVVGLAASTFGVLSRQRFRDVPWWLVIAPLLVAAATILFLNIEPRNFIGWFMD